MSVATPTRYPTEVQRYLRQLRGQQRIVHAVPEGSRVALCGRRVNGNPAAGEHCVVCEDLATRRSWLAR